MFKSEVVQALKFYVYRLIDPRTGHTFYVGKGSGNRVFEHVRGTLKPTPPSTTSDSADETGEDELSLKLQRIREIQKAKLEVIQVIHRHGIATSEEAHLVEAALMDAYPELTNVASGHGSSTYGIRHTSEISDLYGLNTFDASDDEKLILISIGRSYAEDTLSILDQTRFAWVVGKSRAEKADLALAVVQGVVRGVFVPGKWLPATRENFPDFQTSDYDKRFGFVGRHALPEVESRYLDKRVPEELRHGSGNPIRYSYN